MSNPLIPRAQVHAWSDHIGEHLEMHHTSIQRLLKSQRRLSRFVEENQESMKAGTAGVSVYMVGVIVRIFELAGGSLRTATWDDLRAAEQKVGVHIDALLPLDDGFVDRFHAIPDRAQAHILDEAAMAMFQRPKREGEADIDKVEAFKVLLTCWIVCEVLDANWRPAKDFVGETTYTYVHIEPSEPSVAESEATSG
jgi:hypothetical protein